MIMNILPKKIELVNFVKNFLLSFDNRETHGFYA